MRYFLRRHLGLNTVFLFAVLLEFFLCHFADAWLIGPAAPPPSEQQTDYMANARQNIRKLALQNSQLGHALASIRLTSPSADKKPLSDTFWDTLAEALEQRRFLTKFRPNGALNKEKLVNSYRPYGIGPWVDGDP